MAEPTDKILQIEGLSVHFNAGKPSSHCALNDVSLSIAEGEVLGLVGESGSGKTVLSHSILGLLPANGQITGGRIKWKGQEIQNLSEKKLRPIRGKEIAMIFQDPQASLNPVYTVGKQLLWRLKLHRSLSGQTAKNEACKLLKSVQLPDPERAYGCYAHELSGGMAQRAMIAMALAGRPRLLIADESTSALDATIQLEIVSLLKTIQRTHRMAILFITHNMNLINGFCSDVAVMQHGQIVENAPTNLILSEPITVYTKRLLFASGLLQQNTNTEKLFSDKESGEPIQSITSNH